MTRYRAMFHICEDSAEKVDFALSNIENLIDDMGRVNVEVALVVNGKGVRAFTKDSEYAERVLDLQKKSVRFKLCYRSLRRWMIEDDDRLEGFELVPSAVGEIVRRQEEGWAYLRV